MTDDQLTATLAERVLGWKVCPDRFIKSGRAWIPRTRFRPLMRLDDAFLLLDRTAGNYTIRGGRDLFTAEVRIGARKGKVTGESKARIITLSLAQALGIEVAK
jgi:hypothetical protein